MTDDQMETMRNEIAFYACVICSVAGHDLLMQAIWIVLAFIILIQGKRQRSRNAALDQHHLTKE